DVANAIALDSSGNVYITGYSDQSWGSPILAFSGTSDAFIAKLDNNGNLLWNTFLGGNASSYGYAITVDSSGNVYVAGQSDCNWGNPKSSYKGQNDGFAAKLNSGGVLQWNTFLGSSANDN